MKSLGLLRHKLLYAFLEKQDVKVTHLGDPCAWDLHVEALNEKSAVISAGAGNDISFEIELHRTTGANIVLLDPSPTGRQTVSQTSAEQLQGIKYFQYGLTAVSGTKQFAVPANSVEGSYTYSQGERETVSFECRSLKDLMNEHGFKRLDLLKMDIEGFEWEVMQNILDENLEIAQICVEFHAMHGKICSGLQRYLLMLRMRARGYHLISHHGITDHTFIRSDLLSR